jgi:hypothetical protein
MELANIQAELHHVSDASLVDIRRLARFILSRETAVRPQRKGGTDGDDTECTCGAHVVGWMSYCADCGKPLDWTPAPEKETTK